MTTWHTLGVVGTLVSAVLVLPSCGGDESPPPTGPAALAPSDPRDAMTTEERMAYVERVEAVLFEIGTPLGAIKKSITNLSAPDMGSRTSFANEIAVTDLTGETEPGHHGIDELDIESVDWHVDKAPRTEARFDATIWAPFLSQVESLQNVKLYFIRGDFDNAEESVYVTDVGFIGLAKLKSGRYAHAHAEAQLTWVPDPAQVKEDGSPTWVVSKWDTHLFETSEAASPVFADVLTNAIPDAALRQRLRASYHESLVLQALTDPTWIPPYDMFNIRTGDEHPSVVVVDIDQDGWDDLYVMERETKNILLHNNGDGTFSDVAAQYGLDLEGMCAAAVFADYDNDGDQDVLIGRTRANSLYMENTGGRFVDRTDAIGAVLPSMVNHIAVADYDGDGLLDAYMTTYASHMLNKENRRKRALERYFTEEERTKFEALYAEKNHAVKHRVGPPNVLIHNLGEGKFERPAAGADVEIWLNTFSAGWSDFDNDGDQDLHTSSDFGQNHQFRNDDGKLTDVTEDVGLYRFAFGMGVAWGDYDNDGWSDVYLTNMFSKAGRRITDLMGGDALVYSTSVNGNELYKNEAGKFRKVSSLDGEGFHVEYGNWGWGSQWIDVDNDGWLDLYGPCGFYTAPPQVALPEDT